MSKSYERELQDRLAAATKQLGEARALLARFEPMDKPPAPHGADCHCKWCDARAFLEASHAAKLPNTVEEPDKNKGVCDNCGHEGPFAYVAGPPINGGLCGACHRPPLPATGAPPRCNCGSQVEGGWHTATCPLSHSPRPATCGRECAKESCRESCTRPDGHEGYCSCDGPNRNVAPLNGGP